LPNGGFPIKQAGNAVMPRTTTGKIDKVSLRRDHVHRAENIIA